MTARIKTAADKSAAFLMHESERIQAELKYARALCELNSGKAGAWRRLIERAEKESAAAVAGGNLPEIRRATKRMEETLAPLAATAKSYTIHCVGHAHIDMNWMWSWPETVAVAADTFTTVLRLMEEYPAFRFSQSQASVYAILEKYRPDLLKQVARRIRQGRWEVTASHWVECDKNLSSAESLCRHVLYTRQYMQKLFGITPEDVPIDWSPDTFGHAATVPSYLSRAGVKYIYMHRPGSMTFPKRWFFQWEGPDGARVLVRNDSVSRGAYNGWISPSMCEEMISYVKETGLKDFMFVFGVGDHGGGPTRRDIEFAIEMDAWAIFPRIEFSTVKNSFDIISAAASRLPVVRGELNFEFAGCYTTQTLIKKGNRFGENRLVDAEVLSALTSVACGGSYPEDAFRAGWRNVLFNQFHDILPGSGVMDTRTHAHGLFQETMALTSQAQHCALRALAAAVDTSKLGVEQGTDMPASRISSGVGGGVGFIVDYGVLSRAERGAGQGDRPFVFFNPTSAARREVVEVNVWNYGAVGARSMRDRSYSVKGPDGRIVRAQVTGGGGYWGHDHASLAFPVSVPGLGYSVYTVMEDSETASKDGEAAAEAKQTGLTHHCGYSMFERGLEGLENRFVQLAVDPTSGAIQSLKYKAGGLELIDRKSAAAAGLEYEEERAHGMSAWLIQHSGEAAEVPRLKDLRRVHKGPFIATIEADLVIRESELTVSYSLRAEDPNVYVGIRGTWFQRSKKDEPIPVLNFRLPLALQEARGRYEMQFGAIDRDLNKREEAPSLQWAQVTGKAGKKTAGCLLLNDCKYGHSLDGNILRLTLIRSSWDPDPLPEIGQHKINLAIRPFAGRAPSVEEAIRAGQEFNHGLLVLGTDIHRGTLPLAGQLMKITPDAAVLGAIKKAEMGDELVVRMFNPTDRRVAAKIDLGGCKSVPAPKSARELDLLERPLKKSSVALKGKAVTIPIPARGISTVAVKFG